MEQKNETNRLGPAKDADLGQFSRQLKELGFITKLLAASALRNDAIEKLAEANKLRGVRVSPGNGVYYIIQSYVGGKIRSFGSVKLDVFHAARVADMLTFRFGKYRLRFPRETTDADYNYSKTQAEEDYINEPSLREWVDEIELFLRDSGALCSDKQPRPRHTVEKVKPTVQLALEKRLAELESLLAGFENRLLKVEQDVKHGNE